MQQAEIMTAWVTSTRNGVSYRMPAIRQTYTLDYDDMTGTPANQVVPTNNLYSIVATMDDATLAAIRADPNYGDGAILWSKEATG